MEFRRATDDEIATIKNVAEQRKTMPKEERKDVECPEAGKDSLEGGALWALLVAWQDKPTFVIAGTIAILWHIYLLISHTVIKIAHLII